MNREERQILKLSGIYTVIALALFALFWMPFALAQTQTGYCPYDPKIVPPKNLGEFSRTFGTFIAEVGTDGTFYIPVGTTAVTGSGTTGRIGTTTARDLSLPMFGWNGTAWVFKAQGSTTPWSALTTIGSDFVTKWKVGSDEGTGTQRFVAGTGISLVGTCTDGVGTITINAVGTSSAGGWLDTGTQTVASSGYLVRLQGQLILHPDGISGLVDSMIPNTITLDNITQITSRSLADMQGTVNDSQVDNNITLDNITQITNRALANMQGSLDLTTQTTGNYLTNWNCDGQVGTGAVNFDTTDFDIATTGATKTVTLGAIPKGTTSATAGYLLKLNSSGKVNLTQQDSFGTWTSKATATAYLAATDGYVVVTTSVQEASGWSGYAVGLTDSSNPPTTAKAYSAVHDSGSVHIRFGSFTMPVRKGDYWEVDKAESGGVIVVTVSWLPIQ